MKRFDECGMRNKPVRNAECGVNTAHLMDGYANKYGAVI